jgi:hypothetical protein
MTKRDEDFWDLVVVGWPSSQRPSHGVGHKKIPFAHFDFNNSHWLDEPFGFMTKWLHDTDPATLETGDRVFLYELEDQPSFGFLGTITAISEDRTRISLDMATSPRFQGFNDVADQSAPAEGWLPKMRHDCKHMSMSANVPLTAVCASCSSGPPQTGTNK